MQYYRKLGFIVARVEQTVHMPAAPFPMKRDAFGFGDLLITKPGFGAALVQVTDASSVSARINKIRGIPKNLDDLKQLKEAEHAYKNAKIWLQGPNRIFVHGWRKGRPRGKRKTWTLTEHEIVKL